MGNLHLLLLNALQRPLPEDPNPVLLQVLDSAAPEELVGKYGVALALSIFCGVVLVGTLLALYLGLMRWIWSKEEVPSSRSELRLR